MITTNDIDDVVHIVSCNVNSKIACSGNVKYAVDVELPMRVTDLNTETAWVQWKTVKRRESDQGFA